MVPLGADCNNSDEADSENAEKPVAHKAVALETRAGWMIQILKAVCNAEVFCTVPWRPGSSPAHLTAVNSTLCIG